MKMGVSSLEPSWPRTVPKVLRSTGGMRIMRYMALFSMMFEFACETTASIFDLRYPATARLSPSSTSNFCLLSGRLDRFFE